MLNGRVHAILEGRKGRLPYCFLSENGLTSRLDRVEEAITLRNHRIGGDHKGFDGLRGEDLPLSDLKNLPHVLGPVMADGVEYAEAFFSNPSQRLIWRYDPEISVFDVWW